MIPVFLVEVNADSIEGRGPMITEAAFTTSIDARKAARMLGGRVRELQVWTGLEEWPAGRKMKLVELARAKLTPEEREALGV